MISSARPKAWLPGTRMIVQRGVTSCGWRWMRGSSEMTRAVLALGRRVAFTIPLIGAIPSGALAQDFDPLNLRKHLRFLASDALEGRANGSAGQHAAMEYVIAELERLGATPIGDHGFRHAVPLGSVRIDKARRWLMLNGGRDSVNGASFFHASGDSVSFLAFRGSTTLWDSTASGDARGKVVVSRAAAAMPLDSTVARLQTAGAAALIVILGDSARYEELRVARGLVRYFLQHSTAGQVRSLPLVLAHPRSATALLGATDIALRHHAEFRAVAAWNVAAMIRGTDATRRNRHVLFSAHYDHVGIGDPINGDSIYNGLMDNAVGVAAVLEIARAVRRRPMPESSVFLFTVAEEEGSLGSWHFARHSPLPQGSLTAAVNMDAVMPLAPPLDWYVEATDKPAVASAIRALAASRRQPIQLLPLQANSDHWPFHATGTPAVFPVPGDRWANWSEERIKAETERWWRYHRVTDEWSPDFPTSGLAACAAFALDLGRSLGALR